MLALAVVWSVAVGGTGDGSAAAPFGNVQAALDVAQPGDTIEVAAGMYTQAIATKRAASAALPITVRGTGAVVVRVAGRAGAGGGGNGDDGGGCCQTDRGQAWPALLLVALWLRRRRTRFAS